MFASAVSAKFPDALSENQGADNGSKVGDRTSQNPEDLCVSALTSFDKTQLNFRHPGRLLRDLRDQLSLQYLCARQPGAAVCGRRNNLSPGIEQTEERKIP